MRKHQKHKPWQLTTVYGELQFLIILSVLGLNVATSTGRNQRDNLPLIITNAGGLVINLLWIVLAYWTVLNEHCRAAGALQVCLAPCFGMPIIDIVLCKLPDSQFAVAVISHHVPLAVLYNIIDAAMLQVRLISSPPFDHGKSRHIKNDMIVTN